MKRLLALLLILLSLTACARVDTPAVTTAATQPTTEAVPETTQPPAIPTTTAATEPPTIPATLPEPEDADLVRVLDYLPGAYQELRYATRENFTGQVIYDFQDAYLRYGTVKKLQQVCADLAQLGLTVKIWDGFRPVAAQFRLWEVCPNPTYVANPNTGHSSHSRGNTVDLTLVDLDGQELEMPTGFDDFSPKADRNYADCTESARNNAQILESIMEKYGFQGYFGEWWHFSHRDGYPVDTAFCPQ